MRKLSEFEREFRKQLVTFVTGAFSFAAALFWRDAIMDIVTQFVPKAEVWYFKLVTALIVSFVSIFVIVLMSKFIKQ